MQTQSSSRLVSDQSSNPTSSTNTNPKVTMVDQRTMAQLLQAPTEGYEDAIVITIITADNFELKHGLLTLVQNKQFYGHDKEDPHAHNRYFHKITSTLKFPNVPNTSIKLMFFLFLSKFFPSSKTTSLRNEITNFQQRFDESFSEAWDRFKDLLRAFPHYGFLELHQLDTFYNALNSKDQDSLNSAAECNFLDKMPRDCLSIIESKSKVLYSHDNPVVAKVSMNASTSGVSPDVAELKDMVKALLLDKKAPAYQAPAPQTQGVSKEDFLAYVKANDAVMKNVQTQGQNMQNQLTNLIDLITKFMNSNTASTSSSGTLPSNTISNPKSDLKAITTRNDVSYDEPQIPPLVVKNEPEATKDTVNPTNNENTEDVQPQTVQSKPVISEPAIAPVSASKPNPQASIPYPSMRNDERNRMAECLALADLGASINLMPYSVWKRLSLLDLTPTCMTLELAGRLISHPVGVAEDVYIKDVLGFSDTISSGNPTPYHDPIVSVTSSTLTPFENSDFLLEEVDALLAIKDKPTSSKFQQPYLDPKRDILLLEAFLNDDPSSPPLNQINYLPEVRKELKICEAKTKKSSVDEPPAVKLKALPPYLEYAFLEGYDKLPIIITKDLSVEEKTALITVLKSHKRAIAWKLFDIKEVIKLLDAGLIYPISDSPWVSPVHCVPKKGGFTVVENEDNELILTRLVTGWRVCIDYRKLNETTPKDHFPLPFMDQMLERLVGNQYYYFLDDELKRLCNLEYRDDIKIAELKENFNGMSIEIRKKEKLQQLEQWAYLSTHPSKHFNSFCYDDDDDEDYTIAVTPSLSIEEPDNSLSIGDEHLDTILATESDEFIKSSVDNLIPIPSESEGIPEHMCDVPFHDNSLPLDVSKDQFEDLSNSNDEFSSTDDDSFSIDKIDYVEASPPDFELFSSEVMEIVIPEVGGIDDDILLTIKDDILWEKLLNVTLLIAKIKALNANPSPSSDFKTKSSSTSLNSLLEETNTFANSLHEFETLCFDVGEISSGSTTTHSDISLPEYEVFYDDHVKEISSGSPTTHFDSFLYASFIFDLSVNPFPPADRSDFYEFTDELIPFISPPEYDCFLFKVEPNSRDFTKDMVEDISPTKEPQVHNALPTHPTLQLNLKF
nr:reverse transcriptase domain-containing protein [Tanacetum cinerariifolium]